MVLRVFYLLLRKIQTENAFGSNGVITLNAKTNEKTHLNFLKNVCSLFTKILQCKRNNIIKYGENINCSKC